MPAAIANATPQRIGLEAAARRFAAMDRHEAELLIDGHVAAAIREWRVADATLWQRVKFRSRMIRTAGMRP
jgi:hypothetical protein